MVVDIPLFDTERPSSGVIGGIENALISDKILAVAGYLQKNDGVNM